ncbi:hypothetical protein ASC77_15995 [Nocardioides sp. Root1257]|uniref:hypothetical protein n=1 Tax=unclassified Nocardioides TaxID=2615069 RepID=UPI0006F7975C|nr:MULTISPECIES: hypothetical protein [unclassified Nocardioides]KQW47911.1 hypothetical protein ASC77_15995 [Nocardioides sp. Root1257]KRC45163.1 hypothetical protein ASE24_16945 [Nocardioides sp. Root224]
MARRKVFVHVGLPRSGAGFLDAALAEHAGALAQQGVQHPATSADEMFRAAIEIRRDHRAWGYPRKAVEGTWAQLCRRAQKGEGDVVVSQELLATCTRPQIDLLLDGLAGFQVHVVITARGATGPDLASVVDRWSAAVKEPQRLHVLVVPTEGDAREAAWRGLGEIVGFDAALLPLPEPALPAHLVRSLVRAVDGPPASDDDLLERAERWRKALADGGYDVRGDTASLLPSDTGRPVALDDLLQETADLVAALVVEVGELREDNQVLTARTEKLEKKRAKLKRRLGQA